MLMRARSLRADEGDDGADDAAAPRAGAEVHVGVLDLVLQQLVQLQAQLLQQLSHLTHTSSTIQTITTTHT